MIKVRSLVLSLAGAFLLTGAAYASDPAAPPAPPPSPPAEGDTQQTPPPEAPPAPATPAAEKDPLDEVVCRKEEATVGSRLGSRKVCKTRRQWRDEREAATSPDGSQGPKVNP